MELRETIESINEKLLQHYGKAIDNRPKYRVVFSEGEYEKRITSFTDEGFELLHPEVRLLPKYKQYIKAKYILEQLVEIPIGVETDQVERVIYDVLWVFQNSKGEYLPPFFEGCKHVIDSVHKAVGRAGTFTKYKDKNISVEERQSELKKVEVELFGNETNLTDDLHTGAGISMVNENPNAKLLRELDNNHKLVH